MTTRQATFVAFLLAVQIAFALGLYLGTIWQERYRRRADAKARDEELARRLKKPEWIKSTQPQPGTAGFTIAAALNGVGPLGRSWADEPVFVLCARDRAASMTVRDWAALAEKLGASPSKVADARDMADRMEQWREASGCGKVPD